jgi:3-dehydrosphinganine reductase
VRTARKNSSQIVDILCVDLCDPTAVSAIDLLRLAKLHIADYHQVNRAMSAYSAVPDILFCVAGGSNPGFLADITPEGLSSCLESNYYSAIFITRWCLQNWIKKPQHDITRHIVFVSSTAAFVGIPGYIAYTPSKTTVRAFTDTLRQELLL